MWIVHWYSLDDLEPADVRRISCSSVGFTLDGFFFLHLNKQKNTLRVTKPSPLVYAYIIMRTMIRITRKITPPTEPTMMPTNSAVVSPVSFVGISVGTAVVGGGGGLTTIIAKAVNPASFRMAEPFALFRAIATMTPVEPSMKNVTFRSFSDCSVDVMLTFSEFTVREARLEKLRC
eukprot:m.167365 g.167365  ORF g.167365 m.167365 type:complete len:176 (+) comp38929_c1_seq26:435-962(+)